MASPHYLLFLFTSLLTLLANINPVTADNYIETLTLKPLPSSYLLASFKFQSSGPISAFYRQQFELFPRSLGQILLHTKTRELHLKFALGWWDAGVWGVQPADGENAGGTGVEVWGWVEGDGEDEAEAHWRSLNNALSGLFCASLNFIDSTRTIRPVMSFQPKGDYPATDMSRLHLLHGTLPKEPVCTENLTPFLKLLPCKGKSGISTLLDGHKLFDASFQSMSIDVRPVCPPETEDGTESSCEIEITQTIDMVLDIERSLRRRDSPVPRPQDHSGLVCDTTKPYASDHACYPLDNSFDMEFTLSDLFGRSVHGFCPFAISEEHPTPAHVCVLAPFERHVYVLQETIEHRIDSTRRCYVLKEGEDFNLVLPKQEPPVELVHEEPLLYAERSFTGNGQQHGGVKTVLRNPSASEDVEMVYLESLPWYMKPYLHTLKARVLPQTTYGNQSVEKEKEVKLIKELYYRPALDRERGTQLEARMLVPAGSSVVLSYDFDKAVLRYTEYPPDANRGFDVFSAIITIPSHFSPSANLHIPTTSIRTTSLLLPLPTPDFSMPYNVIILTSTIMALAFGSIFNLLVRRFVAVDEVGDGLVSRIREKVLKVREKFVRRRGGGHEHKE